MFSKLSAGVKNAPYFNQAARNIACIAEVLSRAGSNPDSFRKLGFYVLAPEKQIKANIFNEYLEKENVKEIVYRRVAADEDSGKDAWFMDWFLPTLEAIEIREIAWEEIVDFAQNADPSGGVQLAEFYTKCLLFNQHVPKQFAR